MSNAVAVQLIAQALPAPTHPGDGKKGPVTIPLPMFRNSALPADQAEAFAKAAGLPHFDLRTLVSEAIVHTLEVGGQPPTPTDQIKALELAAANNEHLRNRVVPIHCQCGVKIFDVTITDFDTAHATISAQTVKALRRISPECALGHQVI